MAQSGQWFICTELSLPAVMIVTDSKIRMRVSWRKSFPETSLCPVRATPPEFEVVNAVQVLRRVFAGDVPRKK